MDLGLPVPPLLLCVSPQERALWRAWAMGALPVLGVEKVILEVSARLREHGGSPDRCALPFAQQAGSRSL